MERIKCEIGANANCRLMQVRIAQVARRIAASGFVAAAFSDVSICQIDGGIAVSRHFGHKASPSASPMNS